MDQGSVRCRSRIKISEYLEDAVRWHNGRIFYRYVNKLRATSQSEHNPVKYRNRVWISDKKRVKKRWAEHFENVWNHNRVAGKDWKRLWQFGCEGRFILRGRISDSIKRIKE